MSPTQNKSKIELVATAWETLRPNKSFGGLSLAQFKDAIKPSFDARASIAALEAQLSAEQNKRDDADQASFALINRVVNGVKADPEEGDNGDLYEAMGYTRRSERNSGLHRGKLAEQPAKAGG